VLAENVEMSFDRSASKAADAYAMLSAELAGYRDFSYAELIQFIGEPHVRRVTADDSTVYTLQIIVRWRYLEGSDIRVVGWVSVDDSPPMRRLDHTFVVRRP